MNKIIAKIDVSKINKSKIVERKYTDKDGNEVKSMDYNFEVIELKEPKFIKEGETWVMKKTHFIVETQTKEEREQEIPSNFLGDGITFEKKEPVVVEEKPEPSIDLVDGREINSEDIPF